jgi:hypothetical protein
VGSLSDFTGDAEAVHEVVVAAKEIYEFQNFHYAGPCGENSFLEDYTSSVRGVPLFVIVLVTFNAAGEAQRLVQRLFSRVSPYSCHSSRNSVPGEETTL